MMTRVRINGFSRQARFGLRDPHFVDALRTSRGGVRL